MSNLDQALDHLGDVLYSISDMPREDRCRAIDDALAFYNAQRPEKQVEFFNDNNYRRPGGVKFAGYTMLEAGERAVSVGTLGAWEWFQAWWRADLTEDDAPPEDW